MFDPIFVTAVVVLANVVLRNKHVAYVFSIGTAAGLFYLYSNGYNQWLYNKLTPAPDTYGNVPTSSRACLTTVPMLKLYVLRTTRGE